MRRRTPLVVAAAGTAAIMLLAACTSSSKTTTNNSGSGSATGGSSSSGSSSDSGLKANIVNPGYTTKGGTVQILANADFEHLDPVQNYVTNSSEVGRLLYRTLTFIKDTPGQTPTIQPDLATNLGVSSDGGKVWTYTIRKGLKFEDGTPITAKDIKYNIERSFAQDVYKDGPTYMVDTLDNTNNYAGPYKDPNKDLTAVQTPDDYTLQFHFTGPQPDANWMMSLFYTAPVPKAKDTKQNYDMHPISSGPYKISSYVPNKSLTLVRNANWDASTDPNRPALPDKFELTSGIDLPTISQRLIKSEGTDKDAVTLENSGALQNADVNTVANDVAVKARFVNGPGPCIDYEWINTQKVTDPDVRKAIALAVNRQGILTTYGGSLFGSLVDTVLPSSLPDSTAPDLGLKPTGDPAAAKALLQGKTVPTLTYDVSATSVKQKAVATQLQNDLKAVGITLTITPIPAASYYKTIRSDSAGDMGRAGWCFDWPTAGSIVPPVLGPDGTGKTWNSNNFSRYFDATNSAKIAQLAQSTDTPENIAKGYQDVTNAILQQYVMLPTIASNDPQVVGSDIQNAGVSPIYSELDLNTIGVKTS